MGRTSARQVGVVVMMLGASSLAWGQEPGVRPARPEPLQVPSVGGNGHAETWDGRVFVLARNIAAAGGRVGWAVVALRPEAIGTLPGGLPDLGGAAWSTEATLELDGAANTGMTEHNAVAVGPAPGFAENPFRSDQDGTPNTSGAYETYELLVYTQRYRANDDRMGQRRARIVLREPRTERTEVESAVLLEQFQELRQTSGQPLRGIEPTVTFDGRLFIWQGHPNNDGKIDVMMYSWNPTPGATTGWSSPRTISDMYGVDRATVVAGVRFDERYPLAQQPLRGGDGQLFATGQNYLGAYPWISHDGSELVHTSTIAGTDNVDRARRGGLSVIGRLTSRAVRHIDGPLNPTREGKNGTVRLFTSSPGLTPGFWTPYRDVAGARRLPATSGAPTYPLFGSNTQSYGEISFEDAFDGDYTLVLRMNELLTRGATIDARRTGDTSGNLRNGALEQGAGFPQEVLGVDENRGHVGQAVFFPDAGRIRVARTGLDARDGLTVELFVNRLVDLDQDGENRYRVLGTLPGAWSLFLEETGEVHAGVTVGGQERRSGAVGPALPLDRWTHVAFTYEAASGRLRVYLDGELRGEQTFAPGPIDPAQGDLILGPGGIIPRAPFVPAQTPIVALDELKLSRVVRAEAEVAASAYRELPRPALAGAPAAPLPLGLAQRDLRVPSGAPTGGDVVELGKLLFFDPRLSRDGTISCASCHDPARGFTDGLALARGLGGRTLQRNTPTVVNRALSTRQFFDGRSESVEAQALVPIEHPDEMGLPLGDAVAFLDATPEYRQRFQAAFGRAPSSEGIAAALATFQRALLSGDSRADRYEAGDRGALSQEEERGRLVFRTEGRCTACHAGSNFTDEAFHDTAAVIDQRDEGRKQATGRSGDRGRFKTPTLRDVSRTGPYLHDGSAGTLEEVVDLYDRGGLRAGDIEMRPLALSAADKAALVAYLRALDGAVNVTPPTLPPSTAAPAPPAPTPPAPTPPAPTPTPPAPAPAPTPPPAGATQDEVWIARLFDDLLGRAPTDAERDAHVQLLSTGSRARVVARILESAEARARQVDAAYRRVLKRGADPSGLQTYVGRLSGGWSWATLDANLFASDEYRASRPTATDFVTGLYEDILGRAPDAGGLAAHTRSLGRDSCGKAKGFLTSSEGSERAVEDVYELLFGRMPDPSERDPEVRALLGGQRLEDVLVRLAASDAYRDQP
jgi:cytochrome c peroxidase